MITHLYGGAPTKTYHSNTFRSGIFIGTAIPAFVFGIYYSILQETHEQIHAWDALLLIYGAFLVPVVFSMLVGLNILVWTRARVDYGFIFELDSRTCIDYRKYFEVPNTVFATLCYAFWLSFSRTGSSHISPTTWPLVWLGLTAMILLNPLPFLSRSSRFWLLKKIGRLFLSGIRPVEFTDFWMGDQLCSLAFSLSNLLTFVCVYVKRFQDDWQTCGSQSNYWPIAFVLAALPSLIRLAQSMKRYCDSGFITHMINGGKYASGIVNYLFYYLWRHQETHYNPWFALWLVFAAIYSVYASCWDLLMDWSLLRPRAKHFLLRDELGYPNHTYLYYFAIITNCVIRFSWILYIPEQGPNMFIRTFVVDFLEMLRRVQWNFYRLENEHLGNMDQYCVTREVSIPYALDNSRHEDYDGGSATTLVSSPNPAPQVAGGGKN